MAKKFNISGVCYPDRHYMADLSRRLKEMKALTDSGDYFVISRARQYGKTTTLRAFEKYLQPEYVVISMSFQKFSSAKFRDEDTFSRAFAKEFLKKACLQAKHGGLCMETLQKLDDTVKSRQEFFDLTELFELLSDICASAGKKIVLIIDETDQASDNQIFLDFLGQLREYYLNREDTGAFYSVIFSGVYDIRNLRTKLRTDEEHRYNSPWNIAVPFNVTMSLLPEDIVTMLKDYEAEHHTGMNIRAAADELYRVTGGYPYLVSRLCRKLDETDSWKETEIWQAVRDLLKEKDALFEDVIKNIRNNKEFSKLAEQLTLHGANIVFERSNPAIDLGLMFGILTERDGKAAVSNQIFETLILNYFTSVHAAEKLNHSEYLEKSQYIQNGRLNMEKVICRFAEFMKSEYRKEDGEFLERQGRLLFLSFLRPIINGTGHYAVESQTRRNIRMDIQVFYGGDEFAVELKKWRGPVYEKNGYDQLVGYLEARGLKAGYLISFCSNVKKPHSRHWIHHDGHEIYEVIVECG